MTLEKLLSYQKEELPERAEELTEEDIAPLVGWLAESDDAIRYPAFLLLHHRSENHGDVYPYWEEYAAKLKSPNAYQRSIGLMLMADNARWDTQGRLDGVIDEYLAFCDDEKPMVVRLCLQSLTQIVPYKKHLCGKIAHKLMSIDLAARKDTQRKLVLTDIISVLSLIRVRQPDDAIDSYLFGAIASGLLDKKVQREVEALLQAKA